MKRIFLRLFLGVILLVIFAGAVATTIQAQTPTPCPNPNNTGCGQTPEAQQKQAEAVANTSPSSGFDASAVPCASAKYAGAPTPTPSTAPEETGDDGSDAEFSTSPPPELIDEKLPCVNVTFHKVGSGKYFLCTGDDKCLIPGKVDADNVKKKEGVDAVGTNVTFTVCGDGEDELRVNQNCLYQDKVGSPIEEKHYFFGGHLYSFSLVRQEGDNYFSIKPGGFYVSRSYPKVTVKPPTGLTTNSSITVTIENNAWRGEGGTGRWERNNYKILMEGGEGNSYKKLLCEGFDNRDAGPIQTTFSDFSRGTYSLTIQDMTDDSGSKLGALWKDHPTRFQPINFYYATRNTTTEFLNNVQNSSGVTLAKLSEYCKGGFTYYKITCTIPDATAKPSDQEKKVGSCTDPEKSRDPKGDEYKAFLKAINEFNRAAKFNSLPCGKNQKALNSSTNCLTVQTAIGPINVTSPQDFIKNLFEFVLAIAAFGGVILIMVSGYIMMTASGDKEKVQGARETITSAIVGLLFIILSIVILEIIGVDILRLPGFDRKVPTPTPTANIQTR